jgi:LPS export ABC transporter protein LptC
MEVHVFGRLSVRLVAAVVLATVVGISACTKEESGTAAGGRDKPLPDQVISDFALTETSMGQKDWNMKAEKAYVYERRNILEAEEIEVTFFDETGEVRSVLKADYGKLNRNSDDMEARGSVVVTGSDGVILETESLRWSSATRKIASEDSVKVIRNEDELTGWGFRGEPDLGSFRILRKMKATIKARRGTEGGLEHEQGIEN